MRPSLATDDQGRLLIDVRGPRVGAAITSAVLAIAVVVQGPVGLGLVAWQWLAFAISAVAGLAWSPYGNLFRWAKRRFDLGPPPATEPEGPPRFAQACGLAVLTVALGLHLAGLAAAGWVAVGVVLALSVLLATTGLCLGCEVYVLGQRVLGVSRRRGARRAGRASSAVDARDAPTVGATHAHASASDTTRDDAEVG
jgi:hypothetical protein